jgi:hypothetical protein
MRKLLLLLLAHSLVQITFGQNDGPFNPQKDRLDFEGYTIQLMPADFGTYSYLIVKDGTIVLNQKRNPFTLSPIGLRKKEDIFKVAKWQIQSFGKSNAAAKSPTKRVGKVTTSPNKSLQTKGLPNQPLPIALAKELNITIN